MLIWEGQETRIGRLEVYTNLRMWTGFSWLCKGSSSNVVSMEINSVNKTRVISRLTQKYHISKDDSKISHF
jgi:hypothetical protein